MPTLIDDEFGEITIRKSHRSRHIKLTIAPDGKLRASMPVFATVRGLRKLVTDSRGEIRTMLRAHAPSITYTNGAQIGKSHSLLVVPGSTLSAKRQQLKLILTLPPSHDISDIAIQEMLREHVRTILRKEAKHYLPRRLSLLSGRLGCSYTKVRFSHASTRWGSCSSSGTISLNIALMQLPFELIDYVLLHELCHTKQMNHSAEFWNLVEQADPDYAAHRRALKKHSPTI